MTSAATGKLNKCSLCLWAVLVLALLGVARANVGPRTVHSKTAQAEPQKPISVTSELVAIPVNVLDAKGNFVSGLRRENFQIYENNHPQDISLFEQEDTPVTIGLLVDHSGSMESKLQSVVTAISGFTHASNPQDEMFVVNFGDAAKVEPLGGKAFTSDATEIARAVGISAEGRTALYDAVSAGINHLRGAKWQKRALLIVSDGGDNASWYKYSQVLEQARQSQVSIYAVGLVDEFGEEENPKILEELCKATGGIVFFPRSASEIMGATASIARDLREQYMLGFVPEKPAEADSFHKVQVRISAPQFGKLHVRARPGYSVGAPLNRSSKSESTLP